jgi:TctA family transporter
MRTLIAPVAVVATLALVVPAAAQAPPAPTVTIHPKAGQTVDQLFGLGFTYTVATTGPVTFTAKLTLKSHGKTTTLTKTMRTETNYGDVVTPVEYTLPATTGSAATKLRSYRKKGVAVTLSVTATGDGGFRKTLTAKTKLRKSV